jgi:glycosyltransferase involved in cell wall biosynthesis
MKILLLANHFNTGGITTYCLMLARSLKDRGHEVMIASGGGNVEDILQKEGIEHFRVSIDTSSELNPKLLLAFWQLCKIIQRERVVLLHDQTRVTQVLGFFLAGAFKLRRVSTCHGFLKRRIFRRLLPLWGDEIVAISQAVNEHLIRDWHVRSEKIHVIPHGVVSGNSGRVMSREAARRQLQLPIQGITVGALGRLSPVKGYHVLLEAIVRLKREKLFINLLLWGEGPEKARLSTKVKQGGLDDRVIFKTDRVQKEVFFSAIDIFCAPSIQEGLGLSILEAMAYGKPVAASRVGGIVNIIEEGQCGLLVPAEDAEALAQVLIRLANDESLRQRLGKAAQLSVKENFTLERMASRTEEVYTRLSKC